MTHAQRPSLTTRADGSTIAQLHLTSQIVGKVATALLPWRNHGWHLTLRVTPQGLRTEPLYGAGDPFELLIDLRRHEVRLIEGRGEAAVSLNVTTIADFYESFVAMLERSGRQVPIHRAPNELDPAVPFAEDREARVYDPDSAARVHRSLVEADRLFKLFRSSFLGKVSPVHFFWGSFDLAVTRFSGRPAPRHPGGIPNLPDAVTREAYSHEVSSAGFWPGGAGGGGEPFFYSYAYPSPEGFSAQAVAPEEAYWNDKLGEFVLPYAAVAAADDPEALVLDFLRSTYQAAADRAGWDRPALECDIGRPRIPRAV